MRHTLAILLVAIATGFALGELVRACGGLT